MQKQCVRCHTVYDDIPANFGRDKKQKDGLNLYCRPCVNRLAREYDHRRRAEWAQTDEGRQELSAFYKRMYARRREDYKRRMREWRKANPERKRVGDRKRKAAALGAEGEHTAGDVRRQYVIQSGRCFWCDQPIGHAYPLCHVDHLIPMQRGGSNWPWNIVLACPRCNCSRSSRMPLEWAPSFWQRLSPSAHS